MFLRVFVIEIFFALLIFLHLVPARCQLFARRGLNEPTPMDNSVEDINAAKGIFSKPDDIKKSRVVDAVINLNETSAAETRILSGGLGGICSNTGANARPKEMPEVVNGKCKEDDKEGEKVQMRTFRCSALGCPSTSRDVKLHRFPTNRERFKIWCQIAEMTPDPGKRSHFLCSKHFHKIDFPNPGLGRLSWRGNPKYTTRQYLTALLAHDNSAGGVEDHQAPHQPPSTAAKASEDPSVEIQLHMEVDHAEVDVSQQPDARYDIHRFEEVVEEDGQLLCSTRGVDISTHFAVDSSLEDTNAAARTLSKPDDIRNGRVVDVTNLNEASPAETRMPSKHLGDVGGNTGSNARPMEWPEVVNVKYEEEDIAPDVSGDPLSNSDSQWPNNGMPNDVTTGMCSTLDVDELAAGPSKKMKWYGSEKPGLFIAAETVSTEESIEKPFACTYCDYRCRKADNLKRHQNIRLGNNVYSCGVCAFKCNTICSFKVHLKSHMGEKLYVCHFCDYKTSKSDNLKMHVRTHTGERPFACNLCEYRCSTSSSLKRHMMLHTGEKPWECNICGYKCNQATTLNTHMRMHTGYRPYKCDVCSAGFAISGHLKTHLMTHTDEKPQACTVCDYRCREAKALKIHMRTHTGEKPYACNFCDFRFTQLGNLNMHMKRIHSNDK